jgi:outer membrane protein OmpA-like peptidoglycan-associated protein
LVVDRCPGLRFLVHVDNAEEKQKTMKKLVAIGALGLMASYIYAQGLNVPAGQTKDDWEEINFEFNSSILSDGYPSLLRLAEVLGEHHDYKVKVTGNTDYVGSARYNDKLALARAESVKAFLVKYGAAADQITTAGDGKKAPEVNNNSKEGRFMNRRVLLTVTDGQGNVIKAGGIGDILKALNNIQDMLKQQADCCAQILKKLDKLDDILAAMKALQGDNERLKTELADVRNKENQLETEVNGLPKPLNAQETTNIAHKEATDAANDALDKAKRNNQKFSIVGLNIGPAFGPSRTGDFTVTGTGKFFSPFGGDGTHAVQAQGEYMYYPGHQEGQFDIGLVNRWGNFQAGGFASFKYLSFKGDQSGGGLGQFAFLVDYLFSDGRIGLFGTQAFKSIAVLNSTTIQPGTLLQTYAQTVNQYGINYLFGVWGNATLGGNVGYLRSQIQGNRSAPGAELKLTQPITPHIAFTAEADYNQTLVTSHDSGQFTVGFEVGNYLHAKEYAKITTPVPMDIPRIRYELGTRQVGSSPPIANAGPNQIGVQPGVITLNGSGSYDPFHQALSYQWTQTSGPPVTLASPTNVTTTFTAAGGQTYAFRLIVTNTSGLSASANTTVTTASATATQITQFYANPSSISSGSTTTLIWVTQNATSVSITPGVGSVNTSGSVSVAPTVTTTYTLTATGASGSVTQTATVSVGTVVAGAPQIVRFEASPTSIAPGGSSTLSWTTNNATSVSISSVGTVVANGSTMVSPTATTTYTLTATNSTGSVTAPVTVTVSGNAVPTVVSFVANPANISPGTSTKICWQVTNATSIGITPGVGTNLNANDCATVTPSTTTTYTLTANNGAGMVQANVTVVVGTVQILSFTANPPNSAAAGSPVTLSWTTSNATTVVIIGGDIPPTTGQANGTITINPVSNQTYTLTAYGPGGQTVSATISVFVR